jgi:hypothetical protein
LLKQYLKINTFFIDWNSPFQCNTVSVITNDKGMKLEVMEGFYGHDDLTEDKALGIAKKEKSTSASADKK